jgi:hypothetical protein
MGELLSRRAPRVAHWAQAAQIAVGTAPWTSHELGTLLCLRKHIARGRRTRYVLRTLDSEVHPSRVHGLEHVFGSPGVALRYAGLLERARPSCARDCDVKLRKPCSNSDKAAIIPSRLVLFAPIDESATTRGGAASVSALA